MNEEPIALNPCPFCEGPPVPHVEEYKAYVFCHECGAQGPDADAEALFTDEFFLTDPTDEDRKRIAVKLWNDRNDRHRDLYDYGAEDGLNLYPRSDEVSNQ